MVHEPIGVLYTLLISTRHTVSLFPVTVSMQVSEGAWDVVLLSIHCVHFCMRRYVC